MNVDDEEKIRNSAAQIISSAQSVQTSPQSSVNSISEQNNGVDRYNNEEKDVDVDVDVDVIDVDAVDNVDEFTKDKEKLNTHHVQRSYTMTSTATVAGLSPFDIDDERLNPSSPKFSPKYWIRNLRKFQSKDTNYYKPYSLSVTYRNLEVTGESVNADYQTSFINVFNKFYTKSKNFISKVRPPTFSILKSMDGKFDKGDLCVVLGRPGAGCTTLLKSIAAQTYGFNVSENSKIIYDGLKQDEIVNHYRGEVIYNAESEIHFPFLTVWQTLNFAALMRVPQNRIPGVTREQWAEHITKVYMAMYGLSHTVDTLVGDQYVRGVSGGERKRVSIAEASICGAPLQCWDNATRGLDAATALDFVRALRVLCDVQETTVLISIYQCSQDAFNLFDKVTLLYDGYQIYFGPVTKAKEFFVKMGFKCPDRQTDPDFLTSLTSPEERIVQEGFEELVPKTAEEFERRWKESDEYKVLVNEIENSIKTLSNDPLSYSNDLKEGHVAMQSDHLSSKSPFTVSYNMQIKYCTLRAFQRLRGNYLMAMTSIIGNSIMAIICGTVFYNLDFTTSDIYYRTAIIFFGVLFNAFSSLLEIFALYEARPIVMKHKSYALYRPSAEAFSSIISEVPTKLIVAILFNVILYFMTNLRGGAGYFFFYFLQGVTSTFIMSHVFRTIGSSTKSLSQAMGPASIILLALTMYIGFIIPTNYMLGWSRWINYINPIAYTFEAVMVSQFWGQNFDCSTLVPTGAPYAGIPPESQVCSSVGAVPGSPVLNGSNYVYIAFGYKHSHMWRNWGIQMGFVFFFLILYLIIVELNPGAKSKGERLLFRWKTLRKLNKAIKKDEEAGIKTKVTDLDSSGDISNNAVIKAMKKNDYIFHWRNVCYDINISGGTRRLLDNVDGWVKPGTLTALMGASGAGKTTLLDVLAERKSVGVVSGDFLVNGRSLDKSFQRSTGYVQQADLHLETSTVREALIFSALLRQLDSVPHQEKLDYVESVIDILDMRPYADAVVGVEGEGLNVEQRKRLTIGVELAAKPKLLLFLDEPTSGLDSQTAWSICLLMRKLSNAGQAILCTIHQPSAMLFAQFDNLLFLQPGGKTIYFGPIGPDASTLTRYLSDKCGDKCPDDANPAEWMLEMSSKYTNVDWNREWKNSHEYSEVSKELKRMEEELPKIKPIEDPSILEEENRTYAAPFIKQYLLVTRRVLQQYWRTPSYTWSKFFLAIASALFNGFTFFKANNSIQGLQNQMFSIFMFTILFLVLVEQMMPQFVRQRKLYEARERPSRTFSWLAFILAQITVEIPYQFVFGSLAMLCWYYPVGLYRNGIPTGTVAQRGGLTWLLIIAFYLYIPSMGQMCVAGMENPDTAANIATLLFSLTLVFCGVLMAPSSLPRFWIFMYRVSPFTYFIGSMIATAVANTNVICSYEELLHFETLSGRTCGDFMADYISVAGGYLTDPSSTTMCEFCPMSSTNIYLESIGALYSQRWRNWGIFVCYIFINYAGAIFFYWFFRVPRDSLFIIAKKKINQWRGIEPEISAKPLIKN